MLRPARIALTALALSLLVSGADAAKETLRVRIEKDGKAVDTVVLWFDYEKLPEIAPHDGEWADSEMDSVWIDQEDMLRVKYEHSFLAQMGSRKGSGHDYISYARHTLNPADPLYISALSFVFPGDTVETYSWEVIHMNDHPQAHPYHRGLPANGAEVYGSVGRNVGGKGPNLAEGQWGVIFSRESGWAGSGATAIRPLKSAAASEGWISGISPGTFLQAPAGAKAMRILDLQGRLQWEARGLTQGATVEVPGTLPSRHLRVHWISG